MSSYSFSAVNPAHPSACTNETISGMPSGLTAAAFNANPAAQHYSAQLGVTCASRGFASEAHVAGEKTFDVMGKTVTWDGNVWTK